MSQRTTYGSDRLAGSSTFTVQANLAWQDTGITIPADAGMSVSFQSGAWTADPQTNGGQDYGAAGCPGLPVPGWQTAYPLPGALMGALLGRLGDSGLPFLIGNGPLTIPAGSPGTLQLCINDDLTGEYGAGLADNSGSVTVGLTQNVLPVLPLTAAEQALVAQINATWTRPQALSTLKSSLQTAVEIELATIPIYLYTYYSIDRTLPSTSTQPAFPDTEVTRFADRAGALIMSVAVEEMLHMSLASNVLYSLGQMPQLYLNSPAAYPTNLPGHATQAPDGQPMSLPLAGFSLTQLGNFLEIEYPSASDAPPESGSWMTIGQIYSYVRCIISSNLILDSDFATNATPNQIQPTNYSPSSIDTVYPDAAFHFKAAVPPPCPGSAAGVARFTSSDDSHAGRSALLLIDSKLKALQAIQTIDAQGEGFGPTRYDDPSQQELSHYYKFLTLQAQLQGYDPASEDLPPEPAPPPAAATPFTPADLAAVIYPVPENPTAAGYPAGYRDVANLVSGLYQYMLIMTESIFLQQPAQQKRYFNQALHNSMIWILDKIIQAMREQTIPGSGGQSFAPTFENFNLGDRDQAYGTLVAMAQALNQNYGTESWYTQGIQYYVNQIPGLPDVSALWSTSTTTATAAPARLSEAAPIPDVSANQPPRRPQVAASPALSRYQGLPKFPATPPATVAEGGVRHACMGLNSCANQGRTQSNACAGQGYCSTALAYNYAAPDTPTVSDHTCHVLNNCAGQGGCGLYGTADEQANPGANDCATLGSCATPINAERFATEGPAAGQSVWLRARAVFAAKVWPSLVASNPQLPARPPQVPGSVDDPNVFQYGPTIEWIQSYSGQGMTACGSSGMSGAGSCS